ncbi:MAG: Precorrin-8X methylmutase [Cyanobacteria bacterium RI_101]|nr:Precorrin-8X methylmutase [Cyanobacteria bacterium RI_101]
MDWHLIDAQSLALIDQETNNPTLAPAQYEIARRVIYATADFDYLRLLSFSDRVLSLGAAALASRGTLIVDTPMAQAGIVPRLQATFANPVYCCTQAITRPQRGKSPAAWGLQTLAARYPEGIFVIGDSQGALEALAELVVKQAVQPGLVVATPSVFIRAQALKERLKAAQIPLITVAGRKGNPAVAVAIINGLVDLTWRAYEQKASAQGVSP